MSRKKSVRPVLSWLKVGYSILIMASLLLAGCAPAAQPTAVPPAPAETNQPASTQAAAVETTQPAAPQPTQQATQAPTIQPTNPPAKPAERKVATFIWTQEFDSLNPLYTNMWFSTVTHQLWLAWAWDYDEKNQVRPVLVKEMPAPENGGVSADGKTITMKLRDDIKWSDGQPITADDFLFTYKMAIEPKNTVNTAYPYDKVDTMEAPDPHTVVIKFKEVFAPWAMMWRGVLPAHILKPVFDQDGTLDKAPWNMAPTVGAGPYIFKEWESGSFARFVVNDNYWGTKPKIDEIFFRFVPDDASQVKALQAGDGDLGAFIAYSDVPTLKDAGISIMIEPSSYNEGWFFLINKQKGHPALLDVNVRKAIAMSLDREAINKDLHHGLTGVPASFWDALPFWNNPPLQNYAYDPAAAQKLLDDAGWVMGKDGVRAKNGKKLVLKYGTTIREDRQDVQAVAQQQLAKVGIKLELSSYESDTFFADFEHKGPAATGQLDIMEWSDGPTGFPDPDIYYWLCSEIPSAEKPSGTNWFFLCDEQLDKLIKLQASQANPNERQKTIQQINQIFYDQVYWLGIWQDPDVWAVGPRLQGVKFSGVTPFFNITDWDLKAK